MLFVNNELCEIENKMNQGIETWLKQNINNIMTHSHPPITGIVKDCKYCQMFGNVFENGPIKMEKNHLRMNKDVNTK